MAGAFWLDARLIEAGISNHFSGRENGHRDTPAFFNVCDPNRYSQICIYSILLLSEKKSLELASNLQIYTAKVKNWLTPQSYLNE